MYSGRAYKILSGFVYSIVLAKKSLIEIRQLYYKLKDDVFASPRFGVAYNTSALNEILKNLFGTEMTMEHDSENMPKSEYFQVVYKNNKNYLCTRMWCLTAAFYFKYILYVCIY